jgi:hypothetical protein
VESVLWEAGKVLYRRPVIVLSIRVFTQLVVIAHRLPTQDTSSAGVKIETWLLFRMPRFQSLSESLCGAIVIGRISSICDVGKPHSEPYVVTSWATVRMIMSAFEASSTNTEESSSCPSTILMPGNASLTGLAFSSIRLLIPNLTSPRRQRAYLFGQVLYNCIRGVSCRAQRVCRHQCSRLHQFYMLNQYMHGFGRALKLTQKCSVSYSRMDTICQVLEDVMFHTKQIGDGVSGSYVCVT